MPPAAAKKRAAARPKLKCTARWQAVENLACVRAASEASDRVQREKTDKLEYYATEKYGPHLLAAVEEYGFVECLTSDKKIWNVERSIEARTSNGGIFSGRWKKDVVKYLSNTINPIYEKCLTSDGKIPSGKKQDDIKKEVISGIWEAQVEAKHLAAAKKRHQERMRADQENNGGNVPGSNDLHEPFETPPPYPRAQVPAVPDDDLEAVDCEAVEDVGPDHGAGGSENGGFCCKDPQPLGETETLDPTKMPNDFDGGPFLLTWLVMGPLGMHHAAHSPTYKEPDEGVSSEAQRLAKPDGITIEEAVEKNKEEVTKRIGRKAVVYASLDEARKRKSEALAAIAVDRMAKMRVRTVKEKERQHEATVKRFKELANEYLLIGDVAKSRLYKIKQLKLLEDGPEQVPPCGQASAFENINSEAAADLQSYVNGIGSTSANGAANLPAESSSQE